MDKEEGQLPTSGGLNILAGVWLLASPFILTYQSMIAASNDIILGILIGGVGLIRSIWSNETKWLNWVNMVFGIWLIASPFVLNFGQTSLSAGINDLVLGVIVILLAVWGMSEDQITRTTRLSHT